MVSFSSTSDGWYIVNCVSPSRSFSLAISSTISIPSSDQPCDRGAASSSSLVSESVTYRHFSPWRSFEQKLQGQRGLAGAGIAIDQIKPAGDKPTPKHIVEAANAGTEFSLLSLLRPGVFHRDAFEIVGLCARQNSALSNGRIPLEMA